MTVSMQTVKTAGVNEKKSRSLWRDAGRRFVRNKLAVAGSGIVAIFLLMAILGGAITPYDPFDQDLASALQGPSWAHWLGTDDLGRDVLSRLIIGARTALFVAIVTISISLVVGTAFGLMAGYLGPWADTLIMWFSDVVQSIPALLLAMIVTVTLRHPANAWADQIYEATRWSFLANTNRWWLDFVIVFGALSLVSWPHYARLIRGTVLSLANEDYVVAAKAVGVPDIGIMIRHILPNAIGPIVVLSTYQFGAAIVSEAGLSFLGVGVQPPNTSWGSMLSRGWQIWTIAPHVMFAPAIAVAVVRITFNFLGDGLNDALNPKYASAHAGPAARPPAPADNTQTPATGDKDVLLDVTDLRTHFFTESGVSKAVDGVDVQVRRGETMAIVGESGCGKSVTAMSILRILDKATGRVVGGKVVLDGVDLLALSEREIRSIRGKDVAMIFQEPMTSLNPVFSIGDQISEAILEHRDVSRAAAWERALALLRLVGIPSPERTMRDFPHQLSGGMRQRVMIAIALSCDPKLLIADEPTTALDVTIQAQVMALIDDVKARFGMSVMLITHDLGVVAESADRVVVMYAGKVVEQGPVADIFSDALHPYTQGLLRSIPRLDDGDVTGMLPEIAGMVPMATDRPAGCHFHPRCPKAMDICRQQMPALAPHGPARDVRCWLYTPEASAPSG